MGVKRRTFGGIIAVTIGFIMVFAGGGGNLWAGAVEPLTPKQIVLFLHIESDQVTLRKIILRDVPYKPPRGGYQGDWKIELYKTGPDKLLYEKRFINPTKLEMFSDTIDPETGEIVYGDSEIIETQDFVIILPYIEGARRVKIYRQKVLDNPAGKVIEQLIGTIQLPLREKWEVLP